MTAPKPASLDPARVPRVDGIADANRGLTPRDDSQRAFLVFADPLRAAQAHLNP